MSTNPVPSKSGNALSILAIIFGGVSLLLFPIIFGPVALVLAIIAKTKSEKLSTIALIVSIVGPLIGFVLGALVFAASI